MNKEDLQERIEQLKKSVQSYHYAYNFGAYDFQIGNEEPLDKIHKVKPSPKESLLYNTLLRLL